MCRSLNFASTRCAMRRSFSPDSRTRTALALQSYSPQEQIDQRTFVERLHDFKAHLWYLIRHFFRGQFTDEARDSFREEQGKLGKRSQVVGAAQFAQIPILNESQLVARWKLETPPAIVSETQQLPIDGLDAGVYLIEATDGDLQSLHRRHRHQHRRGGADGERAGRSLCGRPQNRRAHRDADVVLWANGSLQSSGKTGSDGLATLAMNSARRRAWAHEPENVWILARHGADAALVTPWGYGFGAQNQQTGARLHLYRPACLSARPHSTHQGHCAQGMNDTLVLPDERTLTIARDRTRRQGGVQKGPARFGARNGGGGLRSRVRCRAGLLQHRLNGECQRWRTRVRAAVAAASTSRSTRSPNTR